ncbi:MAG: selenium-binding protein SBP56-related protein [Trebonia sp.]
MGHSAGHDVDPTFYRSPADAISAPPDPHTLHCGPDGVFLTCLGGAGSEGPGGIALLDHDTFDVLGRDHHAHEAPGSLRIVRGA